LCLSSSSAPIFPTIAFSSSTLLTDVIFASGMASDFSAAWHFPQREQLFFVMVKLHAPITSITMYKFLNLICQCVFRFWRRILKISSTRWSLRLKESFGICCNSDS
jgi:hypothetical protein